MFKFILLAFMISNHQTSSANTSTNSLFANNQHPSALHEKQTIEGTLEDLTISNSKSLTSDICPCDHLSEYATMDTVFERIIGLGSDCVTKGQINLYFCPTEDWKATKKGHADLLDWLIIKDYSLLADAFLNNLTDFFEHEDFQPEIVCGWKTLINTRYDMHWNHLFNSEHEGYWVKNIEGEFSKESIDLIFPEIRRKIDYLKDKFLQAKDKLTLYVIHDKYYKFSKDVLLKLCSSITNLRSGNKNFALLLVMKKKTIDNFQNIFIFESNKVAPGWDGGDSARWKEILDQFKFTLDIWA
ncbi:MAG: hypothetical protein C0432_00055 [Candidatus Puniceispirillum sp.]|nr:hypothetical protein [Candidatus Pelagibacter sp.]MBA4282676.1 hypothetical protein [Candidatus Puniceispirillum sp.]